MPLKEEHVAYMHRGKTPNPFFTSAHKLNLAAM